MSFDNDGYYSRSSGFLIARKNGMATSSTGIVSGPCEVWLNFAEKPCLLIHFLGRLPCVATNAFLDSSDDISLIFDGMTEQTKCVMVGQRIGSHEEVRALLRPIRGVFFGNHQDSQRVEVLLSNFGDYYLRGEGVSFEDESLEWHLASLSKGEGEQFKSSETENFRITHLVSFKRKDGKNIQTEEIDAQVEHLRLFLSFCQGGWVSPLCVRGFGKDDKQIFEHWHNALLSPYHKHSRSWLDTFEIALIADVWSRFILLMREELWRETIKLSFYWFLRGDSEQVGSDGAIILLQAAFERIAWQIFVIDEKTMSATQFKNTKAAEKLRMLLVRMKIPRQVPSTSPELVEFSIDNGGVDGPELLTLLRNGLVHPKRPSFIKRVPYPQAYLLARHYLVLSLLALFNYQGNYISWAKLPRWVGEVERVPWA